MTEVVGPQNLFAEGPTPPSRQRRRSPDPRRCDGVTQHGRGMMDQRFVTPQAHTEGCSLPIEDNLNAFRSAQRKVAISSTSRDQWPHRRHGPSEVKFPSASTASGTPSTTARRMLRCSAESLLFRNAASLIRPSSLSCWCPRRHKSARLCQHSRRIPADNEPVPVLLEEGSVTPWSPRAFRHPHLTRWWCFCAEKPPLGMPTKTCASPA